MLRRLVAFLCALLIAQPACAQMMGVSGGPFTSAATYTGPGDITTFTAWWGFRAYSAAQATAGANAANIRNTTTNETCDFPVTSTGGLGVAKNCTIASNGASLATFCTSGCAVTELYDQTGNGWNLLQATAADQWLLTVSCVNSLPCISATATAQAYQSSSTFSPATGLVSYEAVADRASGTSLAIWINENGVGNVGNFIGATSGTANSWILHGGNGNTNFTASDATFHSTSEVINGSSSVTNVDGTETNLTATGSTTAADMFVRGPASGTAEESEMGDIDNVSLSPTIRTNLCHNMRLYWGTGGSC